jgi:hypothetical protein
MHWMWTPLSGAALKWGAPCVGLSYYSKMGNYTRANLYKVSHTRIGALCWGPIEGGPRLVEASLSGGPLSGSSLSVGPPCVGAPLSGGPI